MPKYLIRVGKFSAGLIEAQHLDLHKKYDDPDDPPTVVKEFEAVCNCAAAQVFTEHQGHEPYDMHFCREDAANNAPDLCSHYEACNLKRERDAQE
tara:strand:- start:25494 stop:25778 length:285 start_codon:yes stop_codon:yes gene_type:complete